MCAADSVTSHSRRAVLAAAVGAAAATVIGAAERPATVLAGSDGDVVLGAHNTATSMTAIVSSTPGVTVLKAHSSGEGEGSVAIHGSCHSSADEAYQAGTGVRGEADGYGVGVHGSSPAGRGVMGSSGSGTAVYGDSMWGVGVHGSSEWVGVEGLSWYDIGVRGLTESSTSVGVRGESFGGSGVLGWSGPRDEKPPGATPRTGVAGYSADGPQARGVSGRSPGGIGVRGETTTGTGVYATATTGYALRAVGRLRLDKCAGVATILATKSRVVVTPGLNVTSASFVLLTPKGDLGTRRLWYTTNSTANTFTIRASTAARANLKIGWLMIDADSQ